MKKYLLLVVLLLLSIDLFAQKKVFFAVIDGEIDLGLAPYIRRVINEAEKEGADAVVFKINTFGGRVDAATQIKDIIIGSKILTIAYVNNRAISAGALITLSCKKIAMVPGSSIGAATVVDQAGQKQSEKYQSYMRSEMRSTAERTGRRTDIAEAMVDERVVIPGLVDSTKLLTLTANEALKYQIADTLVDSYEECLKAFGLQGATTTTVSSNWAEELVSFINNPIVSSLLIMIGFIGIFTELKAPGHALPGIIGIIALALFFGSSYILELSSALNIILFIAGLILLAVEIFVIPGFGVTGISGMVLILASIFLALIGQKTPFWDTNVLSLAVIQLAGALLFSILFFMAIVRFLPRNSYFNRLVLSDEENATKGFVSYPSASELVGKEGTALTTLRPAGSAEINGIRYDVMADWEYIEKGSRIQVLRVEGIKVVVKKLQDV